MSDITSEVVVILMLLVLNGVFAMSELAIVTARKVRLEQRAEDGDKGAQAALARVASPLVALLTGPTNLVMRLFGMRVSSEPSLTQMEIRALIEQGAESGVVDVTEHEIVESVFRLGDRQVTDVMIPRTRMEWIDEEEGLEAIRARVAAQARPWYLVCRGEVDEVVGVMHAEDLLAQCLRGEPLALPALLVQPLYVPATLPALDLLDRFKESRQSIAIALDEHGGVQGIVTLDELVTAVVGEIPEEGETASPDFTRRNERSWVARGDAILEDFESALDLDEIRDSERRGVRTLGGFVMAQLGRVPVVGDAVAWRDLRIEVTHMEGRRVERLAITRLPSHAPAQPLRE